MKYPRMINRKYTPTYHSYHSMLQRCYNPNRLKYRRYGGRGIRVCHRWRESFDNFVDDMGVRPTGTTIHRIDNNGNYTPKNCKWATLKEQTTGRPGLHMISHDGAKLSRAAWARRAVLNYSTFRHRIGRGWSVKRAVETPAKDIGRTPWKPQSRKWQNGKA